MALGGVLSLLPLHPTFIAFMITVLQNFEG